MLTRCPQYAQKLAVAATNRPPQKAQKLAAATTGAAAFVGATALAMTVSWGGTTLTAPDTSAGGAMILLMT